jgi:hypothetical protein
MPISHHLSLYSYWLAKRASRSMPARSDLDPGDIPALLPHLMIVDKVEDRFRYRLVGTAVVRDVGHDATGSLIGSYICSAAPESAASAQAIYERVFATARPAFATGGFKTTSGAPHNMSLLVLPLSGDGANVNMAVSTLASRFKLGVTASDDWLQGLPVKVSDVADVKDAADLEKRCLEWERNCEISNGLADNNC